MEKRKLSDILKKLEENPDGKLSGGFGVVLSTAANAAVLGGQETNNCLGGNCVEGCGANAARGCGGTVNSAAGCGVKTVSMATAVSR